MYVSHAIRDLHERCGVYTTPEVVRQILDEVGWSNQSDLSSCRLLEPCAGDGSFLVEAVTRLLASFSLHGKPLTLARLADRVRAFELHPVEAAKCKRAVEALLIGRGVRADTAARLIQEWITRGDFLLDKSLMPNFTHVVGNPPYVRWPKIPVSLKRKYEENLPKEMVGGDLFVPFLDRSLELLGPDGRVGMICSDRWKFMAFAEAFRTKWVDRISIDFDSPSRSRRSFVRSANVYANILIGQRRPVGAPAIAAKKRHRTLADAGYEVRVGPALGCRDAYVLDASADYVERELLHQWIDPCDVREGCIEYSTKRVIRMYGPDGLLVNLRDYPRLQKWLGRHRRVLKERSIVRNGATWYRPIDRVFAPDWARPKLLVPELAKCPRVALDTTGAIPAHGLYAIFAPDDDLSLLENHLAEGALARLLENIAPKVNGGYFRCYKRFLLQLSVE